MSERPEPKPAFVDGDKVLDELNEFLERPYDKTKSKAVDTLAKIIRTEIAASWQSLENAAFAVLTSDWLDRVITRAQADAWTLGWWAARRNPEESFGDNPYRNPHVRPE